MGVLKVTWRRLNALAGPGRTVVVRLRAPPDAEAVELRGVAYATLYTVVLNLVANVSVLSIVLNLVSFFSPHATMADLRSFASVLGTCAVWIMWNYMIVM
jgi:hypothetical protein